MSKTSGSLMLVMGLSLAWGFFLSAVFSVTALHLADAIHLPLARDYFGSYVSISDERIQQAWLRAGLLLLASCVPVTTGVLGIRSLRPEWRSYAALAMACGAAPGAAYGALVLFIASVFTKGVA